MSKFLILHGTDGSPQSNWFTWLKVSLEKQGHTAWLPQLPNSDKPNTQTYNNFLLSSGNFEFDHNTIIVGHSSGAVEALSLLQNLPEGTNIRAAVLVSAFMNDLEWDALSGLFVEPFDFEVIKQHCNKFTYIHSDNDPYCPIGHAEYLATQTEGNLIVYEGQGHFNTELGSQYREFPKLLKIIESQV